MKIATTTGDFKRYCQNDIERINELSKVGFKYIDLDMYSFKPDSPYMKDDWKRAVLALKNEADKLNVKFVQAHSQGGNPLDGDQDEVDFLVAATIRSIEICNMLGIKNTVVHPGFAAGISKEEWFERNRAFYKKLVPAMEKFAVNVLIENSTSVNMGDMYFANSGADMLEFLKFVDHPLLHACWDTGHANCEGSQYNDIITLGKELFAIHYNDNRGIKDEHLIPFFGTLNHDEVINALIDSKFEGYFTLECSSSLIPKNYWAGGRRTFNGDTRLAEPQLFMQQKCVALMYSIAKYMLTSYDIFEE